MYTLGPHCRDLDSINWGQDLRIWILTGTSSRDHAWEKIIICSVWPWVTCDGKAEVKEEKAKVLSRNALRHWDSWRRTCPLSTLPWWDPRRQIIFPSRCHSPVGTGLWGRVGGWKAGWGGQMVHEINRRRVLTRMTTHAVRYVCLSVSSVSDIHSSIEWLT